MEIENTKMHDKLTALLDTAVKWVPEEIILDNDHPDTLAKMFEKASMVYHKYNCVDGWSIYSGKKYQKVQDDNEIESFVRYFLHKCKVKKSKNETNPDDPGGPKKRVTYEEEPSIKMKSPAFINSTIKWLRDMPGVKLKPSQNAPCCLKGDLDLDPEHCIAFQNGILDAKNPLEPILNHLTPDYYTFNYMPYNYDPEAISMKWGAFLKEITDNDHEMMLLLQQWAGYLLMNTNKHQKFLLCVGDGANGKGVFFDTLTAAVGRENVSNVPLAGFVDHAKLYSTYGKMVNMSNENSRNLEAEAESIIKEYVGGDKMVWRRLYKDAFSDYPTAKLMFATNVLPIIRDSSDGIWRRMIFVPFDVQIPENRQNRNLCKELQQPEELAGILNWMLEGIASLEERGCFVSPKRCRESLDEFKKESDSAKLFASEYLEKGDNADGYLVKADVYKSYKNWCKESGRHAKNDVHFGRTVTKALTVPKGARTTVEGKRCTVYYGIKYQLGMELGHSNSEKPQYRHDNNYDTMAENYSF